MSDGLKVCGVTTTGGAVAGMVTGGLAGFGISIWTLVDYVQPALVDAGLTSSQASGVAAAIGLLGYVEAGVGAGMLAGALAGCVVAPVALGVGYGAVALFQGGHSFFRNRNTNQPATVEPNIGPSAGPSMTV